MSSRIYVGTKAFALRGTLLDAGTIQKLAEAVTLEELVNRLKGTPYSDVVSGLSLPYTARRLEIALRERLAIVQNSIIKGASDYGILESYYLRNIAWDLKLVLKAKALGRTFEEASEFLDMKAEELVGRRELIVKTLSARDIAEAVAGLSGTEFHEDAEKALSSYSAKGELRFFDLYIDHAVLSAISAEYTSDSKAYSSKAADVKGVGDIVATDVDAYNVLSVLRAKLWGLPESEVNDIVVRPTGRVAKSVLTGMAGAETVSEAVKLIEPTYRLQTQAAQGDEDLVDAVEDDFARRQKSTCELAFVWQGVGPAAALALVKLMEFEVGNLAAISIGVEARMDPKKILSRLRI